MYENSWLILKIFATTLTPEIEDFGFEIFYKEKLRVSYVYIEEAFATTINFGYGGASTQKK